MNIELELEPVRPSARAALALQDGFLLDLAAAKPGQVEQAIACRWRPAGERRWRKFTLIPDQRAGALSCLEAALSVVARDLQAAAA